MIGHERQGHMHAEAAFGETWNSGATNTIIELVDEGLNVRESKVMRDFPSSFGHPHRRRVPVGKNNQVALNTLLHASDMELLMGMAFGGIHTDDTPLRSKSYAMELRKAAVSGVRLRGVRCNSLAISATAGNEVKLNFDLIAKTAEKIAAPTVGLPTTLGDPFIFAGAYATINSAAPTAVEGIDLSIANNLIAGPHRFNHNGTSEVLGEIAYLDYGILDITGNINCKWDAETYNDLVRGVATGTIALVFARALESDGTDYQSVIITLNACHFPENPESVGEGVVTQALSFALTRPATSATKPITVEFDDTAMPSSSA